MRKLLLSLLLAVALSPLFSQYALPKGGNQINAGVGFSTWGLPLYFGLDHGVHKDVSLGAEVSFRSYNERWNENRYRHRIIGISFNGNYHFNSLLDIPNEWDFYAGLNVGFYIWSHPNGYYGSHASGLGLAGQVGGRYYFNSKTAINLELGGGSFSGGKFGLTFMI